MVAVSGELAVVLAGLAVLAGYYLRRQEEPPAVDEHDCSTHLFGPVRLLHTQTDRTPDGGVDVFDVVLARCRKCGKQATQTYNIRHIEDREQDWSESADPVVYDDVGRVTPPSTGVRE